MITPSFAITATERVLPKLALDFTTAILDARVTISRALNTATAVNSSGLISTVNANIPRFDYNLGSGGVCKGLLIEEARSNLAINSVFDNTGGAAPTGWSQQIATGTSAPATSTLSTVGVAYSQTAVTQRPFIARSILLAATTTYAASIVIESVSGASVVDIIGIQTISPTAYILNGVSVPLSTTATTGILTIIFTTTTAGNYTFRCGLGINGNITGSIRFSCPQLEAGAFATSYIPTTTTSLTRNADAVTMTGTNFSDWYNSTQGTFAAKVSLNAAPAVATFSLYAVSDGTSSERIFVGTGAGVGGNINSLVTDGGVTQAQTVNGGFASAGAYGYANAYKENNFASSANGGAVVADASGTVPTVNRLNIGSSVFSTAQLNGHMAKFAYYNLCLTQPEVQSFSK